MSLAFLVLGGGLSVKESSMRFIGYEPSLVEGSPFLHIPRDMCGSGKLTFCVILSVSCSPFLIS